MPVKKHSIVFCSSEIFPFVKTGGLADVSGALPVALAGHGCSVKVFMPFYKGIEKFGVGSNGYLKKDGVEYFFIKNKEYFLRDGLYGNKSGDFKDNAERFSYFSSKVLETLKEKNISPDIIHLNDWQTALISVYLKTKYIDDPLFLKTKTLLTIHNLAYQGLFEKKEFSKLGLPSEVLNKGYMEFYGKINFLKAGIYYSNIINTVSPNYAVQIQTKKYGCGLEGVICERKKDLYGILNAIDYSVWAPSCDALLDYKYDNKNVSAQKPQNKIVLQKIFNLPIKEDALLIGMVTRITEQKGFDILLKKINDILKISQLIILGVGDESYQKQLELIAQNNDNLGLMFKFDENAAHKIYAGSDCFLIPSRFEPCGLSQLISYKYGTLPIAHATGGLKDTVVDVSAGGCGFVFNEYSSKSLNEAVCHAVTVYKNRKKWAEIVNKAMRYDFSWDKTALEYIKLYDT
ncbi:MAG: glycogen/starch synthase [Candidatus Omnitrophica bacterium]|nr:glycogen/starch synthase [Candidatus Omnitrophota bacterium]MDD5081060.1 glycogen/starch synthase [Candidatus Omnitrophota bacterium]MDD5441474.1 glycogen/starch synthase [Candidatus Omnitrophota bacterium]